MDLADSSERKAKSFGVTGDKISGAIGIALHFVIRLAARYYFPPDT